MRLLRIGALIIVSLAVLFAAASVIVYFNRDRIVTALLAGVRTRTGLEIRASDVQVHLRDHLVIDLENPEVVSGAREIVKLARIRALISYHALLVSRGLPLATLTLASPDITVPMTEGELERVPLPRPGAEAVQGILIPLQDLRQVAWRIEIVNATVRGPTGIPVVDRVSMVAFRKHWDSTVWHVNFDARVVQAPLSGLHIAGRLRGGIGREIPPHQVAGGQIMYWDARLGPLTAHAALHAEGDSAGKFDFTLADDGVARGRGEFGVTRLVISGKDIKGNDHLGAFSLATDFTASPDATSLDQVVVNHGGTTILKGNIRVDAPFGPAPRFTVGISNVAIDAPALRTQLAYFREVPRSVNAALAQVSSANLKLASATLNTALPNFRSDPLSALRAGLEFSAIISNAAFPLPAAWKLPPVSALGVAIHYAKGVITAEQGSATLGSSKLSNIAVRLVLSDGLTRIPYRIALDSDADMAQLFAAEMHMLATLKIDARSRLSSVGGRIAIALNAEGVLNPDAPAPPAKYNLRLAANRLVVAVKGTPAPVEFRRGTITVTPGTLTLDHLAVATSGGNGTVNGILSFDRSGARLKNLKIDLHQMAGGPWLALVVDPTNLSVTGPIGGSLEIRAAPSRRGRLQAYGKFVLSRGQVQFGFMRSPMIVQGATISFAGHSVQVTMVSSTLEGYPLSFSMSVADLEHPTLRIDADAQSLDFEVLKFIRMPWSPATPPVNFPIPVRGFVHLARGNLGAFPMTDVRTDFSYDDGAWRVWNYSANSFDGKIDLDIAGRKQDDWITIKGKIAHMNAAPLFMLSHKRKESPLLGKIWVAADLRADTNSDFFQTIGGRLAITMRNGTINRFTIISRMLAMIDLKSWLTANIPDPTVSGLPYDSIFADLKGVRGVFQVEQFLVQSPVMTITATGNLDLSNQTMDMSFALYPFSTVNWLVSKIPVIGDNVASGTGAILAAYMHAYGSIDSPTILPMPIRSVTELIKKTLGLPINIVRPNTIK